MLLSRCLVRNVGPLLRLSRYCNGESLYVLHGNNAVLGMSTGFLAAS